MLADAATEIQAARLMVYWAAWLKGQGKLTAQAAAMAKLFATEVSGSLCRLSTVTLLNVTAGGGPTVPVFVIDER